MHTDEIIMLGLILACVLTIGITVVYGIAGARAEKQCFEAGYPVHAVTYDFDIYCSTLQGDVSIKLEKM